MQDQVFSRFLCMSAAHTEKRECGCACLAWPSLIPAFQCGQHCAHRIKLDAAEISQTYTLDAAHSRAERSGPISSLEFSAKNSEFPIRSSNSWQTCAIVSVIGLMCTVLRAPGHAGQRAPGLKNHHHAEIGEEPTPALLRPGPVLLASKMR